MSFFLDDDIVTAANLHQVLYTDATNVAFAVTLENKWFQGRFYTDLLPPEDSNSMAFCELYAIVMAYVLWCKLWIRKRNMFHCDNLPSVNIIKDALDKVPAIMALMPKLTWTYQLTTISLSMQNIFQA